MLSKEIPGGSDFDYILSSQEQWREAKRGIFSRPQEIRGLGDLLDKSIKRAFPDYINQGMPSPIVCWSVLADAPMEPLLYHEKMVDSDVEPINDNAFIAGIYSLNEWATNYALDFWIKQASTPAFLQPIVKIGQVFAGGRPATEDKLDKFINKSRPFGKMNNVNFDNAVFSAIFDHNFSQINELIASRRSEKFDNLSKLAIYLGRKVLGVKDTPSQLDVDSEKTDNVFHPVSIIERSFISLTSLGRFSKPGVIELINLTPATISLVSQLLVESRFSNPWTTSLAYLISGGFLAVLPIQTSMHEAIHYYTSGKEYVGLIPIGLNRKE